MKRKRPGRSELRYRQQMRELVRSLKDVPCADCGQRYSSEVMDFDHVPGRGGKIGSVGSRKSLTAILEEARKCDVVCANCHRLRTRRRHHDQHLIRREREEWLDGLASAVEREREALSQGMRCTR